MMAIAFIAVYQVSNGVFKLLFPTSVQPPTCNRGCEQFRSVFAKVEARDATRHDLRSLRRLVSRVDSLIELPKVRQFVYRQLVFVFSPSAYVFTQMLGHRFTGAFRLGTVLLERQRAIDG
jgi:hypothetical protein